MADIRTPEGIIVRVTGRPPELFLRIITPSGREFGWPAQAGTIGYDVAKEIAGLASEGEPVSLSDARKRKSALPNYPALHAGSAHAQSPLGVSRLRSSR